MKKNTKGNLGWLIIFFICFGLQSQILFTQVQESGLKVKWGELSTRDGYKLEFRESVSANFDPRLPVIIHFEGSGFSTLIHPILDLVHKKMCDLGYAVIAYNKRGIHRDASDPKKEKIDEPVYIKSGYIQIIDDAEDVVRFVLNLPEHQKKGFIGFGQSEGALVTAVMAERFPVDAKAIFNIGTPIVSPALAIEEQMLDGIVKMIFQEYDGNKDNKLELSEIGKIPTEYSALFFLKPLKEYLFTYFTASWTPIVPWSISTASSGIYAFLSGPILK